jgi:hypothetical protein
VTLSPPAVVVGRRPTGKRKHRAASQPPDSETLPFVTVSGNQLHYIEHDGRKWYVRLLLLGRESVCEQVVVRRTGSVCVKFMTVCCARSNAPGQTATPSKHSAVRLLTQTGSSRSEGARCS